MASEMNTLIKQVKAGELTPEQAGEKVKALITGGPTRPSAEDPGYGDWALQRMADKDDDGYENSFNEVVSAWAGGDLTDGQYHTIRDIATAGAAPIPQAAEDEPEEPTEPENEDQS